MYDEPRTHEPVTDTQAMRFECFSATLLLDIYCHIKALFNHSSQKSSTAYRKNNKLTAFSFNHTKILYLNMGLCVRGLPDSLVYTTLWFAVGFIWNEGAYCFPSFYCLNPLSGNRIEKSSIQSMASFYFMTMNKTMGAKNPTSQLVVERNEK